MSAFVWVIHAKAIHAKAVADRAKAAADQAKAAADQAKAGCRTPARAPPPTPVSSRRGEALVFALHGPGRARHFWAVLRWARTLVRRAIGLPGEGFAS